VLAGIAESRPVDVLVNNAGNAGVRGSTARKPFAQTGPEDWEPLLQVNLYGALHCTRAVLPTMMANGWGRIITVISTPPELATSIRPSTVPPRPVQQA
jgi:3-oxoacyl-[acyl-carrier protein] reductase